MPRALRSPVASGPTPGLRKSFGSKRGRRAMQTALALLDFQFLDRQRRKAAPRHGYRNMKLRVACFSNPRGREEISDRSMISRKKIAALLLLASTGAALPREGRPVGVVVGDNDRPYSVFLHAHPVIVFSRNRITRVAAKASPLGYRAARASPLLVRERFRRSARPPLSSAGMRQAAASRSSDNRAVVVTPATEHR